jgi:hypothetical protein
VKRVLKSYYGGRATLEITSVVGEGTRARMRLPPGEEKDSDD